MAPHLELLRQRVFGNTVLEGEGGPAGLLRVILGELRRVAVTAHEVDLEGLLGLDPVVERAELRREAAARRAPVRAEVEADHLLAGEDRRGGPGPGLGLQRGAEERAEVVEACHGVACDVCFCGV